MAQRKHSKLRNQLHEIIFEADTPAGKAFDVLLLIAIVLSVLAVMLESVEFLNLKYHQIFVAIEWGFTILFTIEYVLRIYSVWRPVRYMFSFFGIIDLLAILPTYLSIFFVGSQYLSVIRALRLLRVFRIFKLGRFLAEGQIILRALRASRPKITVFLAAVVLIIINVGSLMYLVEGGSNEGFSSIPQSIYWAVVTLTTVGYGDISPVTPLGQFLAMLLMITGYAIIAVPTGIVSAEFMRGAPKQEVSRQACRYCGLEGHETDAVYCKFCGEKLNEG
jgi:voltage-gated potassium channel